MTQMVRPRMTRMVRPRMTQMREIFRMQFRPFFLLLSAASLVVLSACTTSVPAPVVDRGVRPVGSPNDGRSMPPIQQGTPPVVSLPASPINPGLPGNTPGSQFHVVQRGETLYGIARSNGLDVNSLMAWNNMPPGAPLREGQVLRIGCDCGASPACAVCRAAVAHAHRAVWRVAHRHPD
jgi:hypothetical protein